MKVKNLLMLVFVTALVTPLFFFHPKVVIGNSMSPTIKSGDVVFYTNPLERYDLDQIVISTYNGRTDIKRVVGRPLDSVEVIDGYLTTNRARVTEIFDTSLDNNMYWDIKAEHYFLVGDNREISEDSRQHGAVPVQNIKGRVVLKITHMKFLYICVCTLVLFFILFKPRKGYAFWCVIRAGMVLAYPAWVLVNLLDGTPLSCEYRVNTGLLCPGCGLTTMIMSLLRFDIASAFQANMFAMLSIPIAGCIAVRFVLNKEFKYMWPIILFVADILLWWVLRNGFIG